MNGHIPNGAIPNGVIPNGVIPNGMIPNGTIPNGNIPSGFMPSKLNPNGIPLHGMRHVDPLPEEVWDVFTSQERALYSLIMLPDNHHWFCATLRRWVVRLWTVPSFDNPRPGNRHCFAEYASYVIELCCWSLYFLPPCFIQTLCMCWHDPHAVILMIICAYWNRTSGRHARFSIFPLVQEESLVCYKHLIRVLQLVSLGNLSRKESSVQTLSLKFPNRPQVYDVILIEVKRRVLLGRSLMETYLGVGEHTLTFWSIPGHWRTYLGVGKRTWVFAKAPGHRWTCLGVGEYTCVSLLFLHHFTS